MPNNLGCKATFAGLMTIGQRLGFSVFVFRAICGVDFIARNRLGCFRLMAIEQLPQPEQIQSTMIQGIVHAAETPSKQRRLADRHG